MANVLCPFCGNVGQRTDEHVWAQWLHTTWGASQLLAGTHGERSRAINAKYALNDLGRYAYIEEKTTHVATWLPNVKVPVCGDCNNGWMSRLESATQTILDPFLRAHQPIKLRNDECRTLASWAVKSWMAYALLRGPQRNPFSETEYRAMAAEQTVPRRIQVWLAHSVDPQAHVAMSMSTGLIQGRGETPDPGAPDNCGFMMLSASTVVLAGSLIAPGLAAEPLGAEMFTPPMARNSNTRRLAPEPRAHYFPLGVLPPGALAALVDYPRQLWDAIGLPSEGLTANEVAKVRRAFDQGADPSALRDTYRKPK